MFRSQSARSTCQSTRLGVSVRCMGVGRSSHSWLCCTRASPAPTHNFSLTLTRAQRLVCALELLARLELLALGVDALVEVDKVLLHVSMPVLNRLLKWRSLVSSLRPFRLSPSPPNSYPSTPLLLARFNSPS